MEDVTKGGIIEIHGGDIAVGCYNEYAAIGGGYNEGSTVNIYAGRIQADGTCGAAGIGGGYNRKSYGNINIYGGYINATGSVNPSPSDKGNAAAIGGGKNCAGGNLHIYGGYIIAQAVDESAGIGCGQVAESGGAGTIIIDGGTVKAYGGNYSAGIGGGDSVDGADITINGGHVQAYGGIDTAGIGGGNGGNGGKVTINGGYVYAQGRECGAGIGGGEDGIGADVIINGGTVIAISGSNCANAIGGGHNQAKNGKLSIADKMCVNTTDNLNRSAKENRVAGCRSNRHAEIRECVHEEAAASIVSAEKHSVTDCAWCYTVGEGAHTFGEYGECPACHLIGLADAAPNSDAVSHWADENGVHTVALSGRTLYQDNGWNTLTLPFAVTLAGSPLEGATVMELDTEGIYDTNKKTGYDPATGTLYLYFKEADAIEAGKPYLVKWASGDDIANPLFSGVSFSQAQADVRSQDGRVDFLGNYNPERLPGGDKSNLYMGTDNTLYWPSVDLTVNALRAWFHINFDTEEGQDHGARNIVMNLDENPNAVTEVQRSMINDQRSTDDDAWYDLSGRKYSSKPAQKGIYIHGGKKVIL